MELHPGCDKEGFSMDGIFEHIMLICDMDGTLLDRNSQISSENRKALYEFVADGGRFTVATGRGDRAVHPYLADLPINVPAILCNGAVIHDFVTGLNLAETHLPTAVKNTIKMVLERFPEIGIEIYQSDRTYFLNYNELTLAVAERIYPGWAQGFFTVDQLPWPWLKVLFIGQSEHLAEVEKFLAADSARFRLVYSEATYLELLPEGVSKGQALQTLIHQGDYADVKTVTMGDNLNDLELITVADLGIAVGNAHPQLKKIAKFCACDHDHSAVAHVIGRLRQLLSNGLTEKDALKQMAL